MLTKHRALQSNGRARRGMKETRPLRVVVARANGIDLLECDHQVAEARGIGGPRFTTRRRCHQCPPRASSGQERADG